MRIALALGMLLAGAAIVAFGGTAALEAWLLPSQLVLGLVLGATGALIAGHLLDEDWLAPLRPALEAAARMAPLAALLALPLLAAPGWVYPWAVQPELLEGPRATWLSLPVFRLRVALLLGAILLAAALLVRPGAGRWHGAIALALWLPAAMMLAQDLVLSRDQGWFGSLQGTALVLEQAAAALALAVLVALLRRGGKAWEQMRGVDRALLALAALTIWLWFVQFVVVWMADLPGEAAWYLRRGGGWAWLKAGLVGMEGAVVLLAILPHPGPWRLGLVAGLMVGQHLGHLLWLLRPDAPGAAPPIPVDLAVTAAVLAAGALWWRCGVSDRRAPSARASAR
jgi:hypothetical protein